MNHPIVVGIDGSAGARKAAWWGAKEAARRHAPLSLVHGYGIPDAFYDDTAPEEWLAEKERQSRDWLAEAAEIAERADPRAAPSTESFLDAGLSLLISKSHSAMMVVVGFTARSVIGDLVMGSTGTSLAAHGHCPVAVVRGRDPVDDEDPVVAGADGSPASGAAIGLAFEEAALRGVSLITLRADEGRERVPGAGDTVLAPWREKFPEVTVRQVTTRDDPRKRLLDWSGRAQLVVVGRRGRGGFAGALLGSTSHAMIHHAACPVLVARTETGQ